MSRIKESDLSLEALIINIINEARLKSKKPFKGSSFALYKNSSSKALINNNNKKSKGNKDKKFKCPSYKDLNLSYSFKKCFTINKELRKAFKKRIKRTYMPYFKRDNNNSSNLKSIKKDKDDGEDGGSFIFITKLNLNFYSGFYYPAFLIF